MRIDSTFRIMWLLNHTSARKFEVAMLRSVGAREIFTPKIYPASPNFRSASVDYSLDADLSIPPDVLAHLNGVNWYESSTRDDWALASKYFDVCFFILHDAHVLKRAASTFAGILLWRTYGLPSPLTYGGLLQLSSRSQGTSWIKQLGHRFYFAQAYPHLNDVEARYISDRALYLPLGIHSTEVQDKWIGSSARILFVCPDIAINAYYAKIYKEFISNFGEFPYAIGGAQSFDVGDPYIMGFLPQEEHERNMCEMRVMFYHSQETHHIHFHPFEAVRAGMPLVFMAGGMLDRMGGRQLPGRCKSISEAKKKIKRILLGDKNLINEIRSSQHVLLDAMSPSRLEASWRVGLDLLKDSAKQLRLVSKSTRPKRGKIAVLLPVAYKGGSLRGAKLLAEAIRCGSQQMGEPQEVIFLYPEDGNASTDEVFSGLHPEIGCRTFRMKHISNREARRAMRYAGFEDWEPESPQYSVFDDGVQQLSECSIWVVVSDRILTPILPLRPVVHMVFDYLQRYVNFMEPSADRPYLDAAKAAEKVLVTTEFTRGDALQYAGVSPEKVTKVPMLAPKFERRHISTEFTGPAFFIWTTNKALHKNHDKALKALDIYYRQLGGRLHCVVTGVGTDEILFAPPPHLLDTINTMKNAAFFSEKIKWLGNLPDLEYQHILGNAAFLWHPGSIDNGTFSVVESASLGVPALSSDYPAMREIDQQFSLGLAWMDGNDEGAMALALKEMEGNYEDRRRLLPDAEKLASQDVQRLAVDYWKAIRECL